MTKITSLVIKNLLFSALLVTSAGVTATEAFAFSLTEGNPPSAVTDNIPLSAVNAEVTSAYPYVPFISTSLNFKVNVSNIPPLDPNLRVTSFTAQLYYSDTCLPSLNPCDVDRATFSWTSAPGWRVSSQDNIAGTAYFEALDATNGIKSGSFLDGFNTKGIGIDLMLNGRIKITSVSTTTVPEPLTILGSVAALGFGAYAERKRKPSKFSEKDNTKDS